jgi:hypothetical protein
LRPGPSAKENTKTEYFNEKSLRKTRNRRHEIRVCHPVYLPCVQWREQYRQQNPPRPLQGKPGCGLPSLQKTVCCDNSRNDTEPGILPGGVAGKITGNKIIFVSFRQKSRSSFVLSESGRYEFRKINFFLFPRGAGIFHPLIHFRFLRQRKPDAGYFLSLNYRPENPDKADAKRSSTCPEPPHREERVFFG